MSVSVQQILGFLRAVAPQELALDWDNVGLLVDAGQPVDGVLTTLDITPAVVREAVENDCQLIVSHHPVIFHPLRTLAADDVPALLMGNTLFGGSSNSKLFLNVREKLSLCYYASSTYARSKKILTVSSGIEPKDYDRTLDEIMHQLRQVQEGQWEPWELDGARSTALNSLRSVADSQSALENFYMSRAAVDQRETPEELMQSLQAVTPERICEAAERIQLDTVYFLRGKEAAQ